VDVFLQRGNIEALKYPIGMKWGTWHGSDADLTQIWHRVPAFILNLRAKSRKISTIRVDFFEIFDYFMKATIYLTSFFVKIKRF